MRSLIKPGSSTPSTGSRAIYGDLGQSPTKIPQSNVVASRSFFPLPSPSFPPFSPFSLLPFFPSLPLALPRVSAAWIPHDAPGIPSDLHAENVHRRSARARIHRGEPRPCFHARARVFLLGRTPAGEGPYRAVLARERVVVRLHFFFVLLAGH